MLGAVMGQILPPRAGRLGRGVGTLVAAEAQKSGKAGGLINGGRWRFGSECLDLLLDGRVGQVSGHR